MVSKTIPLRPAPTIASSVSTVIYCWSPHFQSRISMWTCQRSCIQRLIRSGRQRERKEVPIMIPTANGRHGDRRVARTKTTRTILGAAHAGFACAVFDFALLTRTVGVRPPPEDQTGKTVAQQHRRNHQHRYLYFVL